MEEQKKEQEKKPQNNKCNKCGSNFTYVRIKEGSRVCRSCGNIDPMEE